MHEDPPCVLRVEERLVPMDPLEEAILRVADPCGDRVPFSFECLYRRVEILHLEGQVMDSFAPFFQEPRDDAGPFRGGQKFEGEPAQGERSVSEILPRDVVDGAEPRPKRPLEELARLREVPHRQPQTVNLDDADIAVGHFGSFGFSHRGEYSRGAPQDRFRFGAGWLQCLVMETSPLRAGDVIGGCRVIDKLGAGAMGVVYKAHHIGLDKIVAVKVLNPVSSADGLFVERFVREARSAAKLEHPNIVQVYNVGVERERYYIIMQFVEGESLQDVVEREGRLPLARASRIVRSVGLALTEAHLKKIVHRDIKTANILIGADGRVRLTDFGLARTVETNTELTGTGTIMGTPGFIAPEVLQGAPADYRADQYAVGVVYYCLLSGILPFRGKTPYEVFSRQLTEEPAALSQVAPEVPDTIVELVHVAMAKDPTKRFSSMPEFVRVLDQRWRELSAPPSPGEPAASTRKKEKDSGRMAPVPWSEHARRVERTEARSRLFRNAASWLCLVCAFALAFALASSGVAAVDPQDPVLVFTPFTAPFSVEDVHFLHRAGLAFLGVVTFVVAFVINRRQLYFSASPAAAIVCFFLALGSFYDGIFMEAIRLGANSSASPPLWKTVGQGLLTPLNEVVLGLAALGGALAVLLRGRGQWGRLVAALLLGTAGFSALYRFAIAGVREEFARQDTAPWDVGDFHNVLFAVFAIALAIAVVASAPARRSLGMVFLTGFLFIVAAASLYAFGGLCAVSPETLKEHAWLEVLWAPIARFPARLMSESGFLGIALALAAWGGTFLYLRPRAWS